MPDLQEQPMKWCDVSTDDPNVHLRVIQLPGLGCLFRDQISGSLSYVYGAVFNDGVVSVDEPPVSDGPPSTDRGDFQMKPGKNSDSFIGGSKTEAGGDLSAMSIDTPAERDPTEAANDVTKREEEFFLANREVLERKNVPHDPAVLPDSTPPLPNPAPPEPEKPVQRPDTLRSQLAPRLPDPPAAAPDAPRDPRAFGSGQFRIG